MLSIREEKTKIKWWHSLATGGAAGIADASLNYPWTALRIMFQSTRTIKLNPVDLYRGVTQYALSITPTTAVQTCIDSNINQYSQSSTTQCLSAFLGGIGGALVSTPSEHLILTQQQLKSGPCQAIKALYKISWTRPWTGFIAKAGRDSGYSVAMLWGQDAVADWLSKNSNLPCPILFGGTIAGTLSAVLTQPFDVISTKMQCYPTKIAMRNLVKKIYAESNLKGFFPGFWFRTGSVVSGVIVMGFAKKEVERYLQNNR